MYSDYQRRKEIVDKLLEKLRELSESECPPPSVQIHWDDSDMGYQTFWFWFQGDWSPKGRHVQVNHRNTLQFIRKAVASSDKILKSIDKDAFCAWQLLESPRMLRKVEGHPRAYNGRTWIYKVRFYCGAF